ncbi:5022_t:CDS:2 [Acaulospora colombiana]|uniref:5022_t:CDS:1 n=1 Tax=Acaulospora colombiana TaxID=27376 RepID=A0ACA9L6F5_9GLOM|nr:5022_t:CDS:2 [Acaulospora colombiana]
MAAGDSLRYHARTMNPPGPPATYGSRTMTLHPEELAETEGQESSGETSVHSEEIGTLKLRGGQNDRKVKWDNGVVDNEGMGKKKSKSKYFTIPIRIPSEL